MITINYNGKTYRSKGLFYHIESIIDWIVYGELVEVKENEDSILEKLRNELEETQEEYANHQMWSERKVVQNILDLLTSLETKEEPTHKGEHQNDVCSKVTPQFTPGKEDFSELPKINDTNLLEEVGEPIEDKIELLPAYEPSEPDWRDMQISLLTRTVNKLINK